MRKLKELTKEEEQEICLKDKWIKKERHNKGIWYFR
jgi:hypothetical protein